MREVREKMEREREVEEKRVKEGGGRGGGSEREPVFALITMILCFSDF